MTCTDLAERLELLEDVSPLDIQPMYSLLPADLQAEIFGKVDGNSRKVIVSTDIAETSLTGKLSLEVLTNSRWYHICGGLWLQQTQSLHQNWYGCSSNYSNITSKGHPTDWSSWTYWTRNLFPTVHRSQLLSRNVCE